MSLYRLALRSSPQHLSDMNLQQSDLKITTFIPPFRSSLQFFPFSINNVQFDGGPDPGLASRRPPGQLFNLQVSLKFPVLRPISAEFGHLGSGPTTPPAAGELETKVHTRARNLREGPY